MEPEIRISFLDLYQQLQILVAAMPEVDTYMSLGEFLDFLEDTLEKANARTE